MTEPDTDDQEEIVEPCPRAGDPRDPNYDPRHKWEAIGQFDGETVYQCLYCKKSKCGW